DLRPGPPDAGSGEGLVRRGAEVVADAGVARRRLDGGQPAVWRPDAIAGLQLVALATEARNPLLRVLDSGCQAVPLGVDPRPRLLLVPAVDRQREPVERTVEQVEVAAVEGPGEVLLPRQAPFVVEGENVKTEGLTPILPAVAEGLA